MDEILIRGAAVVVTMDGARREIAGGDVLIRGGVIAAVGQGLTTRGTVLEAAGCVVTPGLVNTHHHLYQTLTRAVPGGQDALLFGWLKVLYPIWGRFGPEEMFVSAQIGLAELALSGCTLTSDHLYLYPNGARLDDTIAAAAEVGLRFHPTRGAMSIGESAGACRLMRWWSGKPRSWKIASAWSMPFTTRARARWCASGWRPVRRFRSAAI